MRNRGSILRKKENVWKITIELEKDASGKRNRKYYTYHGTRKGAGKFKTQKLKELDEGLLVDENDRYKFGMYLDCWLKSISKVKKPTTIEEYSHYINKHIKPHLGNIPIKKLKTEHIQKFYNYELEEGRLDGKGGVSPKTLKNIHRIIHPALESAYNNDIIYKNVSNGVVLPKVEKYEAKFLCYEQVMEVLEKARTIDIYIPVAIGIFTGARRGEVLGLKWEDIDFKAKTIFFQRQLQDIEKELRFTTLKTKSSVRKIDIPQQLVNILKQYKIEQAKMKLKLGEEYGNSDNAVCVNEMGKLINPKSYSSKFKRFLKKNDLPQIRFHDLRHTHASLLYSQHIPDKFIAERLGHSSCVTTKEIYTHLYKEDKIKVGNIIENIFENKAS